MDYVAFDTETHRIEKEKSRLAPPIVCGQLWRRGEGAFILKRDDLRKLLDELLSNPDVVWVLQRAAYDFACICSDWPELRPLVFQLFEDGRVRDVMVREKILNLGSIGSIEMRDLPSGGTQKISYRLDAIIKRHLGIELAGKDEGNDGWRVNFDALEDVPLEQWPKDAVDYALGDIEHLVPVLEAQDALAAQIVPSTAPFAAEPLTVAAAFALYLMTCTGVPIDGEERSKLEAWVAAQRTPEKEEPLYQAGILRRPQPARPHSNQWMKVKKLIGDQDPLQYRTALEAQGIKFTEPVPASRDMKVLAAIVTEACEKDGRAVLLTPTGKVSTSDEFLAEIEHLDPRLALYHERMQIEKLVTTELPRIQHPRVHPNYDELKETGRTSSWDPNVQNVHPKARPCYVPDRFGGRPGLIASVDYSGLELVTLGQKVFELFGKSTHRDFINQGIDNHAWLGAQLAKDFDPQGWEAFQDAKLGNTPYEAFLEIKNDKTIYKQGMTYYKFWRTFAKPVGLGFPGGLGPDTMVTLAKGTYGILIQRDEAARAREVWHETYPEMRDYFEWVNRDCQTGEETYAYMSPMGMLRNHCTYCACANGAALQTPAAEGAKMAIWDVVRACFDPSQRSILYGCRPWGFVHDQLLVSIPDDAWAHERCIDIGQKMVHAMKRIVRDVEVRVEPSLMRRWYKEAEPVYDERGRLQIWEPKQGK